MAPETVLPRPPILMFLEAPAIFLPIAPLTTCMIRLINIADMI
jgi:hypothetical protein